MRKQKRVMVLVLAVFFLLTNFLQVGNIFAQGDIRSGNPEATESLESVSPVDLDLPDQDEGEIDHNAADENGEGEEVGEDPEVQGIMETSDIETFASGNDLGNIFTFKSLKINGIEADENQVVTIADGTTVSLEYNWVVGSGVKSGDYAEIDVPKAFKFDRIFADEDIELNDGTIVGKYNIINNKIRFEFDDRIVENSPVENGVLGFAVEFNEERFTEDVVEEVKFNDTSNKTITIIGKPTGKIKSIAKSGTPDATQDAKNITWVIDVTNPSETEIINAKVKDLLPAGLEIDPASVIVNNLAIGLNGNLTPGSVTTDFTKEISANKRNLEMTLPKIAPYTGYRVTYTTKIIDFEKTSFTNDANLIDGDKKISASATVDVSRSSSIEKDGRVKGDNIEWDIDVNKAGGIITDASVDDALPAGTTLVPGSIKILKLTKSGDAWTESPSDKTANEFPVELGDLGPEDTYRIKFETSIDYSIVNGGEYQKENAFENVATLKSNGTEVGTAKKPVTIIRKPILAKTGKSNMNYTDKTITWTVTVNKANHKIDDATVTDTLPAGLMITSDDIEVLKGNVNVTNDVTITVPTNDGSSPTTITIGLGDISEEYTIKYTTTITDFTKIPFEFKNGVSLGGTGIGVGVTVPPVSVKPAANEYSKSTPSIDYNEKMISWLITANPTREAISELTITDTFPNKGLILLEDSLEVKVGGTTLVQGTGYTLSPRTEDGVTGYQKGFIVEFMASALPINAAVNITFKTSYDPEKGIDANTSPDHKYLNNAKFIVKTINGNEIELDRPAERIVNTESWNSGKKLGKLKSIDSEGETVNGWTSGNERKIEWEVYINYLKQDLGSGVTVTDTLNYDGKVDISNIKVKTYTVAANGDTTLGEVLDPLNYTVEPAENNKGFTLTFKDDFEVKERYAIIFTTSVPDISLGTNKYKNTAITKVGDKDYSYTGSIGFNKADKNLEKSAIGGVTDGKVYTDDEINWKIKINEALSIIEKDVKIVDTISPGLVYKQDSLKVYRLEGSTRIPVDANQYTLTDVVNPDGTTVLTLIFKDSISSTYEIEYTTVVIATTGTVNNKVEYSGTNLDKTSVETVKLNAQQSSYVGGDPSKGKIIINKVDSDNKSITAEAEFKVYYLLNGEPQQVGGQTHKTVDGKIELGNLALRTYYIQEITAPNGFKTIETPTEVIVNKGTGKDNGGAYFFYIKNDNIKTEATATKVWVNGPAPRPDIELELYRKIEGGEESKVLGEKIATLKDGTLTYTWEELNKTDNAGRDYIYTVKEVGGVENYTTVADGLTVTNTYVSPKIDVTGTKIWENGPSPTPSIELQLYRNGIALSDKRITLVGAKLNPITLKGKGEYTWTNLDKTDSAGIDYLYTVKEVGRVENYTTVADELTVTNTYVSPKIDVTGTKIWENGPRPVIELQLYQDNNALGQPVTLASGITEYTWKGLDKTDKKGVEYKYTIDEVKRPDNYTKQISEDGLTITNIYVIPKTTVTGTKKWVGGPSTRPTIQLQLYKNGEAYRVPETLENGTTKYTWTDLDKTDIDGKVHKYTVDEVNTPANYGKSISDDGLTIANTYQSPITQVTGRKAWVRGPEEKPTIKLQLFQNNLPYGKAVTLKSGENEYTWKYLASTNSAGIPYKYTIDEVGTLENYEKSLSENGLTITNTFIISKEDVVGRKIWIGGPEEKPTIQLQLYQDSKALGDPVTLESGTTEYTWTNLDMTDGNGKRFIYTIDEIGTSENYGKSISEDGRTITVVVKIVGRFN